MPATETPRWVSLSEGFHVGSFYVFLLGVREQAVGTVFWGLFRSLHCNRVMI